MIVGTTAAGDRGTPRDRGRRRVRRVRGVLPDGESSPGACVEARPTAPRSSGGPSATSTPICCFSSRTRSRSRSTRSFVASTTTAPGLRVLGGLASAAAPPGGNRLAGRRTESCAEARSGCWSSGLDVRTVVSQGCRPIGEPFVVTRGERNFVAGARGPARARASPRARRGRVRRRSASCSGAACKSASSSTSTAPSSAAGTSSSAAWSARDRDTGAIAVGEQVVWVAPSSSTCATPPRPTRTSGRCSSPAHVPRARCCSPATGAGRRLFGVPDHDAGVVDELLGPIPLAGMFCAGEIGPVGGPQLPARLHRQPRAVRLTRWRSRTMRRRAPDRRSDASTEWRSGVPRRSTWRRGASTSSAASRWTPCRRPTPGHPGTPMALAPARARPVHPGHEVRRVRPEWPDRDRFVLSAGHASMLLYSYLYLSGFGLDSRRHRAVPPVGLGDARATPSMGTPRASRSRPARSDRASPTASAWRSPRRTSGPASAPTSSTTTSSRSAPTATSRKASATRPRRSPATSGSASLVYVYDDNHISIDGPTELAYSDDVPKRFEALRLARRAARRGGQRPRRARARASARAWPRRSGPPCSSCAATSAGRRRSTPTRAHAHGNPLGADEVAVGQGDPRAACRGLLRPRRRARVLPRGRRRGVRAPARHGSSTASTLPTTRRRPLGARSTRASRAAGLPGWESKLPQWEPGEIDRDTRRVRQGARRDARRSCPASSPAAPTSRATPARS